MGSSSPSNKLREIVLIADSVEIGIGTGPTSKNAFMIIPRISCSVIIILIGSEAEPFSPMMK